MSTDSSPKPTIKKTDNLKAIMKDVADGYEKIKTSTSKRGEANAEIKAVLAKLETQGVMTSSMRFAMAYVEMSEDQRRGFDIAYQIAREALGMPIEPDMFDGE